MTNVTHDQLLQENIELRVQNIALADALLQIHRAVRTVGPAPRYHRRILRRHRREWPALWRAIDNAVNLIERIPVVRHNPTPRQETKP
jgi:hypothetical protein